MLARHLLFIATRRHPSSVLGDARPGINSVLSTHDRRSINKFVSSYQNNTLLAIDSVPPHGTVQPPPYISPPRPDGCQKGQKIQDILKEPPVSQTCEKPENYGPTQKIYTHDPRQTFYDNNNQLFNYNDPRQVIQMRNARNQQYYVSSKDVNQFYTLPSRRPQREVEPPRSVTPDITRGLRRGSLSAMHMLARHGQKTILEQDTKGYGSQVELSNKNLENEADNRLIQGQQQPPIVDVRNRFATPLGLTALGYRFFASSPIRDPVMKSPSADALKHNPISPIRHTCDNSYKPSTPSGRGMPTVAERLALTANNNHPSSMPNSGRSTPVQTSSGRSTPTNLILSPTKSTMSNEELFAAIHKSKKRLNIKDDSENQSPYGSTNSLAKMAPGSRNSWSSEPQKPQMPAPNPSSPSPATSRLDFKRLLLQQSVKTGPTRLSAAEQLKLSRQQSQHQQSSPIVSQTTPLAKVLSPRSVWRFQTPRTDVLSSTIIEDTAAEEKAMKPSPENISPVSRLNARRQLDLCSDLPDYLRISKECNDRVPSETDDNVQTKENRLVVSAVGLNVKSGPMHNAVSPTVQYSTNSPQLTSSCQQAISAFESRRISNQLARAQFLASTPTTNQTQNTAVRKVFRARSVSPQNAGSQNVARSPSAPTLETAL